MCLCCLSRLIKRNLYSASRFVDPPKLLKLKGASSKWRRINQDTSEEVWWLSALGRWSPKALFQFGFFY